MKKNAGITRREFLGAAALAGAGLGLMPLAARTAFAAGAVKSGSKTPVALVIAGKPLKKNDGDLHERFAAMLDEAIRFVAGVEEPDKFWASAFSAGDRVAIKVNGVGGKVQLFGPYIATVIAARLASAGLPKDNVFVYDRSNGDLRYTGYKLNRNGGRMQCYGSDQSGYEEDAVKCGSVRAHFSKVLTGCDALINLPVLKTHSSTGVSVSLKNHYGSIKEPSMYHANGCDPYIGELNASDMIRKKTRLIVCDATRPQYDAGPIPDKRFTWNLDGILVGLDPVAVDRIGVGIIEKHREEVTGAPSPVTPDPAHIHTAARLGLGTDDLKKIDFKTITV
jgi:hypothetical protein